jgi:Tfp pilus assembly protein PilF
VEDLVRSLDEAIGLTRATDLRPWLDGPTASIEAVRAFLQGAEYTYLGRPDARLHFDRAIEADSNFIAPRVWLVSVLNSAGDTSAAREHVRMLRMREATATPFEQAMIGWADAVVRGDLESRANHLRVALRHSPRNNVLLYNLGSTLRQLGRYQEAAEPVRLALESGWKYYNLHVLWGVISIGMGEVGGLRQFLQSAMTTSPQSPYLFGLLEALALFEGDPVATESYGASFRQRVDPSAEGAAYRELVPVYLSLAELAQTRGARDRQLQLLHRAADADPHNALAHLRLARAMAENGDRISAERHYRIAGDTGDDVLTLLYLRADVAVLLGRINEARGYLSRYLELAPEGPDAVRAREKLRSIAAP